MEKRKNGTKVKIFSVVLALLIGLLPVFNLGSAVAYASEANEVEENAKVLEYIFTELYTKDESGLYVLNEDELEKSEYSSDDLKAAELIVQLVNGEGMDSSLITTMSWKDTVARCIQDAYGIGKKVLNEIMKEIEKGNYIAAAGKLTSAVGAGTILGKPAALAFILLCGAENVS